MVERRKHAPDQQKLVRLTQLESMKDKLLLTEAEKDERRKNYVLPPEGLNGYELSRDGSSAAFSYKGDLYTVSADGSAPPFRLTRTKAAESEPQFSPDASRLASIRDGQIVVQNLRNGQLWQVTDVEDSGNTLLGYRWSPDGRRFVYVVRKGTGRQMPLPNYAGRFVTVREFSRTVAGDETAELAVFVIAAEGGDPVPVDMGEWGGKVYLSEPKWSPDSEKLLLRVVHPRMKQLEIRVIDAETGKVHIIFEETDEAWVYWATVGWSPDSRNVFFTSERDGWAHQYRVPAEGGEPVQLTRGQFETRPETFGFEPQWIGDYIYYTSTEDGASERHFYRIQPDGAGKEKLSRHEGLNCGLVSEDGKYIAWMRADLKNPFDLYVGDRRVTQSPRPEFHRYQWPETRFVSFPSRRDGRMVSAKMLLPPGYLPEDRTAPPRPAVFFIHGAGYATSVLKQWGSYHEVRFTYNCYLANKGYVIMDLDYRGSSGYGRDWRTGVYLHMGGPDLDDVLGAVDYLRSLGNVDMRRLGIWGVSYGGFMTNMAMFLAPDTFRAGSSWAAVNDWENYNSYYTTQRLNTPERNPEAYRRSSPIQFSGMLKNHLLIVHGMVDSNVLFQDAVQLTEKLIHEGKQFSHIYYPEENHGFVRDETWIDACRRTTEWFDRYLR
jgi:dipeptidyl aminopeptidase/acylaminoacyl peptidase